LRPLGADVDGDVENGREAFAMEWEGAWFLRWGGADVDAAVEHGRRDARLALSCCRARRMLERVDARGKAEL
jgi:hypothetical protein